MRNRGLTMLILFIGGILLPCLLVSVLLGPQRAPGAITFPTDWVWTTALQEALRYRGFDVNGVEIRDGSIASPTRNLVVVVEGDLDEDEAELAELVEGVHYEIGDAMADWPFVPEAIGTVTLWVYPQDGEPYTEAVAVEPLAIWERGDLDWDGYAQKWLVSGNAPAELFDG